MVELRMSKDWGCGRKGCTLPRRGFGDTRRLRLIVAGLKGWRGGGS